MRNSLFENNIREDIVSYINYKSDGGEYFGERDLTSKIFSCFALPLNFSLVLISDILHKRYLTARRELSGEV